MCNAYKIMRIIGGEYKGRKIKQPKQLTVRPTKDRVREAVFNIIAGKVPDSGVLDLFAGSGAYGLEALSRGAKQAVFVEKNKKTVSVLKENIQMLELEGHTAVLAMDVKKGLEFIWQNGQKFDVIFCDPPYSKGIVKKTLNMINHYDILKPSGLMIIEHHRDESIPPSEGNVFVCKQKSYKNILISVFQKT
ncbi:MAG: 16S rRNA (guanine(966)-N(2))-methyltransferase RsmD [Candidatus Omnitrophota bacterium]